MIELITDKDIKQYEEYLFNSIKFESKELLNELKSKILELNRLYSVHNSQPRFVEFLDLIEDHNIYSPCVTIQTCFSDSNKIKISYIPLNISVGELYLREVFCSEQVSEIKQFLQHCIEQRKKEND